ncbi:MAG TPA: M28 family peptidase, partial [bacterium]|nr:M28 family peptidase [bacterium]
MKNRFRFLFLTTLLLTLPLAAQKMDVPIDGQRILGTVSTMASHEFMGRKPNTPEFFRLQDWVVEQYRKWAVEPAGENGTCYQDVPIGREYAVTYGTPGLVIDGREFYSRFGHFSVDTRSSAVSQVKGDIVFAGYGISSPDKGLDEYADVDVRGKIVLVFRGNPAYYTPPRGWTAPRHETREEEEKTDWTVESTDSSKFMTAFQKGAAGVLFFDPESESGRFRERWQPVKASPFERNFIVLNINEEAFRWILWTDPQVSMRGFGNWIGRVRGDVKNGKARSFRTHRRAVISGYEKVLYKGEKFGDNTGRNVIAKIPGTDPELKDEYVVIGAHFDHLGVNDGQVYTGAEDNASGSAVVMEIARLAREHRIYPKRTIVLCLWTGEELGLIGSRYWVENPTDGVTMDRVVAYFNMDMVGLGEWIGAPGALNFPSIWEVIIRDQDENVIDALRPRTGGPGGSDHSPFIELGIQAMALMTGGPGGHPDYHDTGDSADKLSPEILAKTCRFVLQGAVNLANETETRLLIADRRERYRAQRWNPVIIDPGLGADRSWTRLECGNVTELTKMIGDRVHEMRQAPTQESGNEYRRLWRGGGIGSTGIKGARTFGHLLPLMRIAKDVLEFQRLDTGEDGVWFDEGLTDSGAEAL